MNAHQQWNLRIRNWDQSATGYTADGRTCLTGLIWADIMSAQNDRGRKVRL